MIPEGRTEGWTVDTLATHIERQLADMRSMLQERYETQTKAVDAAFLAQQTAMQTALTAAKDAVQTALAAAEKAADKALLAADKRFEVVTDKMEDIDKRMQQTLIAITSRLDLTQGRSTGLDRGWSWLIGVIGIASVIVSIVINLKK